MTAVENFREFERAIDYHRELESAASAKVSELISKITEIEDELGQLEPQAQAAERGFMQGELAVEEIEHVSARVAVCRVTHERLAGLLNQAREQVRLEQRHVDNAINRMNQARKAALTEVAAGVIEQRIDAGTLDVDAIAALLFLAGPPTPMAIERLLLPVRDQLEAARARIALMQP